MCSSVLVAKRKEMVFVNIKRDYNILRLHSAHRVRLSTAEECYCVLHGDQKFDSLERGS